MIGAKRRPCRQTLLSVLCVDMALSHEDELFGEDITSAQILLGTTPPKEIVLLEPYIARKIPTESPAEHEVLF